MEMFKQYLDLLKHFINHLDPQHYSFIKFDEILEIGNEIRMRLQELDHYISNINQTIGIVKFRVDEKLKQRFEPLYYQKIRKGKKWIDKNYTNREIQKQEEDFENAKERYIFELYSANFNEEFIKNFNYIINYLERKIHEI